MEEKKCPKCGTVNLLNKFNLNKNNRDGHQYWCKLCHTSATASYRKRNVEKAKASWRACYKANPEKIKAYVKAWKKTNAEKVKAYKRTRYKINFVRLNHRISGAIRKSLNGNKQGKHWESLTGYTLEQLKKHIEGQFNPGMNWLNYGDWHIDHQIPIAIFNFERPEDIDFKKCWALSNLKPLWAKENQIKGTKINKPFQPSLSLRC